MKEKQLYLCMSCFVASYSSGKFDFMHCWLKFVMLRIPWLHFAQHRPVALKGSAGFARA